MEQPAPQQRHRAASTRAPTVSAPLDRPSRNRPHEPRRCTARSKRSGVQCRRWSTPGQLVCSFHGSKAPKAIAAAERRHVEAVAAELTASIDLTDAEPLTDVLGELSRVAGEVVALKDQLVAMVAAAPVPDVAGLAALERALDRTAALLTAVTRLGIEDRVAQVEAAQLEEVHRAVVKTLADLGVDASDVTVRKLLASHLRH